MENNSNVDIFIITHKNFETERTNPVYKILCCEDDDVVSDKLQVVKVPRVLSNDGWSEWAKIFELYKSPDKYGLKDWVGMNHYHRYFSIREDVNFIPDIDETLNGRFCLSLPPVGVISMREQYAYCHNVEDFDLCMDIAGRLFPDYKEMIDLVSKSKYLFASNIVLLRRADFLDMCKFVFDTLFEWCREMGINPESDDEFHKRVNDNLEAYKKKHKANDDTYSEQARIPAYLSERLVTVWLIKNAQRGGGILFTDMSEK